MKHFFNRKPHGGQHEAREREIREEVARQLKEKFMATFDEIMAAVNAKHAEKDSKINDLTAQVTQLQADKDKLTADLAAATAAATAVPALPDGALSADQSNQILTGVQNI